MARGELPSELGLDKLSHKLSVLRQYVQGNSADFDQALRDIRGNESKQTGKWMLDDVVADALSKVKLYPVRAEPTRSFVRGVSLSIPLLQIELEINERIVDRMEYSALKLAKPRPWARDICWKTFYTPGLIDSSSQRLP